MLTCQGHTDDTCKFQSAIVGSIDNLQLFGFSIIFLLLLLSSLFLSLSVSASFCRSVFNSLFPSFSVVIYLSLSVFFPSFF